MITLLLGSAIGATTGMVVVGPGLYHPLYPASPAEEELAVPAFRMDALPVTSQQFLAFVSTHPQWGRGRATALFVDEGYLGHWESPSQLGAAVDPRSPVTQVSWWAARAYCEAHGARLPTEAEWEMAAAASTTQIDASGDPARLAELLAWYGQPGSAALAPVGQRAANVWGVHDLHGLVWEWIEDFNSALVSGDNRDQGGADNNLFCGVGALSAKDKEDYAAFMRVAFRSSLQASYTTRNLGFRCASDLGEPP